jgi:hypothetical protein
MFWRRSREFRFSPYWAIPITGTTRRLSKARSKIAVSRCYATARFHCNVDTAGLDRWCRSCAGSSGRPGQGTARCSCFGNHSVAGPRARFCRLCCKVSSRLATLRALPRWPGQTAWDWSSGPASAGRKISRRFEPGRIFTGLYQSWSRRDQPTGTLLLSRGYVCYPVSTPASLTLLSSSLYTQIYSLCRSTRP